MVKTHMKFRGSIRFKDGQMWLVSILAGGGPLAPLAGPGGEEVEGRRNGGFTRPGKP